MHQRDPMPFKRVFEEINTVLLFREIHGRRVACIRVNLALTLSILELSKRAFASVFTDGAIKRGRP